MASHGVLMSSRRFRARAGTCRGGESPGGAVSSHAKLVEELGGRKRPASGTLGWRCQVGSYEGMSALFTDALGWLVALDCQRDAPNLHHLALVPGLASECPEVDHLRGLACARDG